MRLLDRYARIVLQRVRNLLGRQRMRVYCRGWKSPQSWSWHLALLLWASFSCLPSQAPAADTSVALPDPSRDATIIKLRVGMYPTYTRVVLETTSPLEWTVLEEGTRGVRVVVPGGVLAPGVRPVELRKGLLRSIRPTQRAGGSELALAPQPRRIKVHCFSLTHPDRIVIDVVADALGARGDGPTRTDSRTSSRLANGANASNGPDQPGQASEARSSPVSLETSAGLVQGSNGGNASLPPEPAKESRRREPSLAPKGTTDGPVTVVLDPGHGGHDTGAMGPEGLMEKDVVLDLALRLRRLLQERLGVRVVLTRDDDVFVPLQERSSIANRAKADFFISLHVNGSSKRGAVGFETFYFTREPSDNDARASAQRENLMIEREGTTGGGQESLLRMTLADMAVTRDIRESGELAELALGSLDRIMKVENRGVKSGPFYVLARVAMPAVLVESAFITNPKEERKLQRDEYRQRIAEALCEGIGRYKARYERRVGLRGAPSPEAGS
ncbi:MAG TPA: N-acetylmuramoyl-L-alanine amidase [Candidatus Methylomirabilis sp.]|nr:N-acetylmuramoyl-L-alanine amidase [Candidatus Methylomirabilis sp.]HSB81061.1 N-acetylmuramoyl-L-alanine amidase [Candidatus Methylomirabilis sp.]